MAIFLAPWALLGVAAMWGISFVWMKDILDQQDVYSFLTSRFIVAALVMLILRPKVIKHFNRELITKGLLIGTALGSGYIFQTLGLDRTTPALTGFITGDFILTFSRAFVQRGVALRRTRDCRPRCSFTQRIFYWVRRDARSYLCTSLCCSHHLAKQVE